MTHILMIIAPDQFRDEELLVPRAAFLARGFTVDIISTQAGKATGMLGATETITQTVASYTEAHPTLSNVDALVVVGGMGALTDLWDNNSVHQTIKTVFNAGKTTAAICLSGGVLANAGILGGKKATVWDAPPAREAFDKAGATYTGEPVTVDGSIITANGPDAAKAFAQAIIDSLVSVGV